jgi:hypothetical protein
MSEPKRVKRVSALAEKAVYGVITPEILEGIFYTRILTADLISRSSDRQMAFEGTLIRNTLETIKAEFQELIR